MPKIAIKITEPLKVKNKDINKYLKVVKGDEIKRGMCLAKKSGVLGSKVEIVSPIDGVVENIDLESGQIEVLVEEIGEKVMAQEKKVEFKREKKRNENQNGSELEVLFCFGKGSGRGIFIGDNFSCDKINYEFEGLVLLSSFLPSKEMMYRAAAMGVEAIISNSFNISEAELLKQEVSGKIRTGFSLLPERYDLRKFEKQILVLDGENGLLFVKSS